MAIITVSRGSFSKGKEIAEAVAERLGYDCISRELLLETSERFNIPELRLVRALHDAPSILDRFLYGKERYVSFIQSTFLEHAVKDNLVYHGLAGHYWLKGVSHCLKVRILSDIDDRVRLEMDREGMSSESALHLLRKDDEERRKWAMQLYHRDPWDPSLYDLVVHIHRIQVEDAVEIICHTAQQEHFKTTPESQSACEDLLIAARVKNRLVESYPNCEVSAKDGHVMVNVTAELTQEPRIAEEVKLEASKEAGVKEVRVNVMPAGI